jgi:hypothetical protein
MIYQWGDGKQTPFSLECMNFVLYFETLDSYNICRKIEELFMGFRLE